jgi:hypothetical protein
MDIADLHIDGLGRLVLVRASGEKLAGIVPVRCFPFGDPRRYISLCDEQGCEVESIDTLDELPVPLRTLIERELERRELVPKIARIVSISPGAEPTRWEVETDHGQATFTLHSEDDVRRLEQGALIVDDRGLRFHIPDQEALDALSQGLLRRYL